MHACVGSRNSRLYSLLLSQATSPKSTVETTVDFPNPSLSRSQNRVPKPLVHVPESSISVMRPIRLPEPPSGFLGTPEIFEGGVNAVRRAVVIGNGFAGAENQSIGLVRALGLADKYSIYVIFLPSIEIKF